MENVVAIAAQLVWRAAVVLSVVMVGRVVVVAAVAVGHAGVVGVVGLVAAAGVGHTIACPLIHYKRWKHFFPNRHK
jgi:hypothetical protein